MLVASIEDTLKHVERWQLAPNRLEWWADSYLWEQRGLHGDAWALRPTEQEAFLQIWLECVSIENGGRLTDKQRVAFDLYEFARRENMVDAHGYVMRVMAVSRDTSSRWVQQADGYYAIRAIKGLVLRQQADYAPYIIDGTHVSGDDSRRKRLRRIRATLPRECAGGVLETCKRYTGNAAYPLCKACHKEYGERSLWPEWLKERAQSIDRELYQETKALLETVSLDALDE